MFGASFVILPHSPNTSIRIDAGVIGTCSELCGKLADKVNSTLVGEICDIVCSIAGIEAFIDIIEK